MKLKTVSLLLLCWVGVLGAYAQLKAPEGFVCVEEQPEGELRVYTRHGKTVKEVEEGSTEEDYRRYVVKGGEQDGNINLVFAPDGVVWFQRPVSDSYYDGWVRGTLSPDRSTITVPMGQYTAYTRSFDMAVQVWMMTYDADNDTFVPDQSVAEVSYTVLHDGSIALNGSDENHVMGCVNRAFGDTFHYLDFEWNGNGDYATVYTQSDEVPLTPPAGLQTQSLYATTGWHDGVVWTPYQAQVSLGFDGDVVWLQGLSDLMPKSWVKGLRRGDRLSFASRQFLGAYFSSSVYLIGVEPDAQGNPAISDSITFTANADGSYTSFNDIMVSSKRNDISYLAYYMGMTLAPELDRTVTPPDGLRFSPYTLDYQEPDDQGRLVTMPSQMVSTATTSDGRLYLQGITPFVPEAFIEGTLGVDRQLTFRSPQYMGEFFDESTGIVYPIYFQAFHGTTGQLLPEVTFAYDEATHAYVRPTTAISIGINKTGLLAQQYIYNATLTPTTVETVDTIGYCDEPLPEGLQPVGLGEGEQRVSAAIHLPRQKMMRHAGQRITKIRFAVRQGFENVSVWIRTPSLNTSSRVVQSVSDLRDGWNEVVLNNPYTIDGSELYIGYTATQPDGFRGILSYGVGDEHTSWLAVGNQWYDYHDDGLGILCIEAVAEGEQQNRGAAVISLLTDRLTYMPTETLSVSGEVENLSDIALNAYELSFYVDGELKATQNASLTLQPDEVAPFTQTLTAEGLTEGQHSVQVVARTGDRQEDMSATFYVYETTYPRTLLLEHFTSLPCVNCPRDDAKLEEVCHNRTDVAWVAHHVGYKEDEFTIAASQPMVRYGVNGNPYVMLDRTAFNEGEPPAFTVSSFTASDISNIFDYAASVPAFMQLNVTALMDEGLLEVDVTGEGKAFFPELYPRATIHVYLMEDEVLAEEAQAGDATKKYHNNILRKVITPARGVLPSWDKNNSFDYLTTVELDPTWRLEHLRVVAFVAAQAPTDTNYPTGEVLNTAQVRVGSSSGIVSVTSAKLQTSAVYTLDGRRVSRPSEHGLYVKDGKKILY